MEWLGPQKPNRSTAFLSIKYSLVGVLVISIVCCAIGFTALVAFDLKIEAKKYPNVNIENLRKALVAMLAIIILISAVGLYGVIREHFVTTVIYAGCMLLATVFKKDDIYAFIVNVAVTAMSFIFAAMLKKADRALDSQA